MGIEFGKHEHPWDFEPSRPLTKGVQERTETRQALNKIKDILEDSKMIKTNNKRYWEFWKLVELTEKEIKI